MVNRALASDLGTSIGVICPKCDGPKYLYSLACRSCSGQAGCGFIGIRGKSVAELRSMGISVGHKCPDCGGKKDYRSIMCRSCRQDYIRKANADVIANLDTSSYVYKQGHGSKELWSYAELDKLCDLRIKGYSYDEIAQVLNRTSVAIQLHISRLGDDSLYDKRWWSNSDLAVLSNSDLSTDQIAAKLGRSLQSVYNKRSQLGTLPDGRLVYGSNHPAWRGGSVGTGHYGPVWKTKIRPSILDRDDYCCVSCGLFSPSGVLLTVHHIVPWRLTQDHSPNNLVSLCKSCHGKQVSHWWHDFEIYMIFELPYSIQQVYFQGRDVYAN